jgi:hypothetical protein
MGNVFSPSFEAREQSLKKRREELSARGDKLKMNENKYRANKESLRTNITQYVQKKRGEIGPASEKIDKHRKLLERLGGGGGGGGGGLNYNNALKQLGGGRRSYGP